MESELTNASLRTSLCVMAESRSGECGSGVPATYAGRQNSKRGVIDAEVEQRREALRVGDPVRQLALDSDRLEVCR